MGAGRSRTTSAFTLSTPLGEDALSRFGEKRGDYKGILRTGHETLSQLAEIEDFERKFLNNDFETLRIIDPFGTIQEEISGNSTTVNFNVTLADIARGRFKYSVLVHNHPPEYAVMFSRNDINTFSGIKLNQIRLVDKLGYSSVLSRTSKATDRSVEGFAQEYTLFHDTASSLSKSIMTSFMPQLKATYGHLPKADYQDTVNLIYFKVQANTVQNWFKQTAPKFGLEYESTADYTHYLFNK